MSFQPTPDALTYEPHFGLNEKPFSLIADSRFVYESPAYLEARDSLLAAIRRREGLLVLTGEVGAGKTTLCRGVVRELGRKTCSSLVPDPLASREDLVKMLLIDFGVVSTQDLAAGSLRGASRTELGYLLSEFVDALTPDAFVVVIIDDAQNLSLPLIEETRILSDAFGAKGRLQIVLAGSPELHARLKLPEMRQVEQRVCGHHRLAPLSREAVSGYIQHRLQVAGGHRDRVLFPAAIVDVLHQRSGGLARLINRLCDRALQIASERGADAVNREILDAALSEDGSATQSPTWDSLIFGSTQAPQAPAASVAPVAPAAPVARVASVAPQTPKAAQSPQAPNAPSASDEHEGFRKEFADWLEQDIAPPTRTLTSLEMVFPDDDGPLSEGSLPPQTARRDVTPLRTAKNGLPRVTHSETSMQRLWRTSAKRAGIALAACAGLGLATVGGSFLYAGLTPGAPPAVPRARAAVAAGLVLPEAPAAAAPASVAQAPVAQAPVAQAPVAQVPAAQVPEAQVAVSAKPASQAPVSAVPASTPIAGSEEYLVVVGLFSSRPGADKLVAALTQEGLPATQRPFQLRQQPVQQVVLGPFSNRSDAARDLRRLQGLGGHDDARLVQVASSQKPVAGSQKAIVSSQ